MLSAFKTWLRKKDLNPHKQSQSLPCCHYTIPQYLITILLNAYYYSRIMIVCQYILEIFFDFLLIKIPECREDIPEKSELNSSDINYCTVVYC